MEYTAVEQRADAIRGFMDSYQPDVLCVQELRPESMALLDEALPRHERIEDSMPGWTLEGNVYFNADLMQCVAYGSEDVGILEEHRRLFWVRLRVVGEETPLLIGNVHLTHQGHPLEVATGQSPRRDQILRVIDALRRLSEPPEPVLLMGDLNDPFLPQMLLHEAGYESCFAALGMLSPPTWPCYPTANFTTGEQVVNQAIDWIFHNRQVRAVSAQVPHYFLGDAAASDHWPVQAVYELPGRPDTLA